MLFLYKIHVREVILLLLLIPVPESMRDTMLVIFKVNVKMQQERSVQLRGCSHRSKG